jgi:spoIIIJ-associated protein
MDEAIDQACEHFNLKREKMEIEILSGGSSGIFGLVGVKKARIKARPRGGVKAEAEGQGKEAKAADKPAASPKSEPAPKADAPKPKNKVAPPAKDETAPPAEDEAAPPAPETSAPPPAKEKPARPPKKKPHQPPASKQEAEPAEASGEEEAQPSPRQAPKPRREARPPEPKPEDLPDEPLDEAGVAEEPPLEEPEDEEQVQTSWKQKVDRETLEEHVREVLAELLKPIATELNLRISEENARLDVYIDDDENSGLIIGREGQTLSALQYMVNRIVSRRLGANVRIQLDTGDYREKQNERLRTLAQDLAERAKSGGRVQSTRPLSSYHRRVVHLALQGDEGIQTRSKGEGPMKKVLILPKRRGPRKQNNHNSQNNA